MNQFDKYRTLLRLDQPWVFKLAIKLVLLILSAVLVRACLPERSPLGTPTEERRVAQVVLLPTEGVPVVFTAELKRRLEKQHPFGVLVSVHMGIPSNGEIDSTGQYRADILARAGADALRNFAVSDEYGIVLTNRDINAPESGLRFLFSQHYPQAHISVISTARLNAMNGISQDIPLPQIPVVFEQTVERARKLINKAIGIGVYRYALSSDKRSVMYSPIMSLTDLDEVGDDYLGNERQRPDF